MSDILFNRRGHLGLITLNRPKALNALNIGMVREMRQKLMEWESDDEIHAVVVMGSGDRAFCAGGDVVSIYKSGQAWKENGCQGEAEWRDFFHDEYLLNATIFHYSKPYVAILNGIVMGGGVGVSVHGSHRVATENTLFAMPETGLGLIPDVGGGYFMPRLPGNAGMYLALKGDRLKAADCRAFGVCNSYVPVEKISDLLDEMEKQTKLDKDRVSILLAKFNEDAGEGVIAANRDKIDQYFDAENLRDIFDRLWANGGEWALDQLKILKRMSPTSMLVTFQQMKRGATMEFNDVMKMEYCIVNEIMKGEDFYEGVRAILLEKDMKPFWMPEKYKEISDEMVEAHFQTPESGPLDLN